MYTKYRFDIEWYLSNEIERNTFEVRDLLLLCIRSTPYDYDRSLSLVFFCFSTLLDNFCVCAHVVKFMNNNNKSFFLQEKKHDITYRNGVFSCLFQVHTYIHSFAQKVQKTKKKKMPNRYVGIFS